MKTLEERLSGLEEDYLVVVQGVTAKLDEHAELLNELSGDVRELKGDVREIKARMATVEARMGTMDMRLNRIDERLDTLGEEMHSKFGQIITLLTQSGKTGA
jgi:chromosome segregation ATPase